MVFTIGSADDTLSEKERATLKSIDIHHITPPFDRTSGSGAKSSGNKSDSISSEMSDRLADWVDRQIPMDSWILLFRAAYSKILKEAEAIKPRVIWSTGDPWSGHWLGHKLSQDLSKPWIADFRDPWTLSGLTLRNRSYLSDKIDRYLEKKFITEAEKVIFTSGATEQLYSDYYSLNPAKTETIYNSFNDYESNLTEANHRLGEFIEETDKLNVLFFGSFRRLSPAKPIAVALAELPDGVRDSIRIHSFGKLTDDDQTLMKALNVDGCFTTHEKVLPEQAPLVFDQADVLLVSTSSERQSIIPAKLWEYLTSDKPIFSIAPNPEIGEILEKTGAGVHIDGKETGEISEMLQTMVQRKREGLPLLDTERSQDVIDQYSAKKNTQKLAQIMDTLTGDEQ